MAKMVLPPDKLGLSWKSGEDLIKTLKRLNVDYNLGLTKKKVSKIKKELESCKQSNDFRPFCISIWLGSLEKTFHKLLPCLADSLRPYGLEIGECFYGTDLSFSGNSMTYPNGKSILELFVLDFGYDSTPQFGERRVEFRVTSPEGPALVSLNLGIEIISFLIFNPQVLPFLNKKTLGTLKADGIKFCGLTPAIGYSKDDKKISISFQG